MPRPFPWCTHFECRGEYFRLKRPVLIATRQGGGEMYRVRIDDHHYMDLSWSEVDTIFRQVSPIEAKVAAEIDERAHLP